MTPLRPALLLAVGFWALPAPAASNAPRPAVPQTEELIQGTLPNGFRYALLPRATEPGRISLRLVVHAGSIDERDDESGCAHFVEHMAFNGTEHFPPGKLVPFFQRLGLAWGADANAETSFTHTTYKLDLPPGNAAHLPQALQIFRDFAGGIAFAESEVRRERSVVLSELNARDTNDWQTRLKKISILYAGTGLPERLPTGNRPDIARADSVRLRAFYERCYRPDRMTLVAVGDIVAPAIEKQIARLFGTLKPSDPAIASVEPGPLSAGTLTGHVITNPLSTAAQAMLTVIEPVGADTPTQVEAALGNAIAIGALDRRLSARQAEQSHQIGRAEAFFTEGLDRRFVHYGLTADASVANWPAAVELIETERRRARDHGFSPAEVSDITAAFLTGLRANQAGSAGRTPEQLANAIAATLAAGRAWLGSAAFLALAENYLAHFNADLATERLRAILPDDRIHVVLTMPVPPEGGADTVLAAYRASAARPLAVELSPAAADRSFPYVDFGPAGAITSQTTDSDLGVSRVLFANGTRLNLRPSTTNPGRFYLWARLGRGTPDVPRDRPGINHLGIALLSRSDLGRLSRQDLKRLTDLHAVEGNWSFTTNDFIIQLSGPSTALPFALQSLTAYIADVKLEAAKLPDAWSLYPAITASLTSSTSALGTVEILFRATGADPRFRIPPAAEVRSYSFEVIESWIRKNWLEGPLEVGIAGDVPLAAAVQSAAASIGTLSPRREATPDPAARMTLLSERYRNLFYVDLPDKTSNVRLFWPLTDAANLRTFRALQIANAALRDRLRTKFRQQLGVTYSPGGSIYRAPDQPSFSLLAVELTFEPAETLKLSDRAIQLADEFARGGMTKDEFTRAREPLRAGALADLQSNEWWLANVLLRAQSQPEVLDEARSHASGFDAITRNEANGAARQLTGDHANASGFIPQAPPATKK